MDTTQATSLPASKTTVVKETTVKKTPSVWRLRIIIMILILMLLLTLGGAAYGGYYAYTQYQAKNDLAVNQEKEIDRLSKLVDASTEEMSKKIEELTEENERLKSDKARIADDLKSARERIDQLTPKNIRDVKYQDLIKIDSAAGDVWLNAAYYDLTGDGKLDAVYAYRSGGAGSFLNVYAYTYNNENKLIQILKTEGYQKGTFSVVEDKIIEITSQAGTPEEPKNATTKFGWSSSEQKMVRI